METSESNGNGQAMSQQEFEQALRRIHEVTGTRTQVELADILGIRQSSVSDAKRRGSIPADWLIKLLDRYGIAPHWVRTGEGLPFMAPSEDRVTVGFAPPEPVEPPRPSTEQLIEQIQERNPGVCVEITFTPWRRLQLVSESRGCQCSGEGHAREHSHSLSLKANYMRAKAELLKVQAQALRVRHHLPEPEEGGDDDSHGLPDWVAGVAGNDGPGPVDEAKEVQP